MKQVNLRRIYDRIDVEPIYKDSISIKFIYALCNYLIFDDIDFDITTDILNEEEFIVFVKDEQLDKFYGSLKCAIEDIYTGSLSIDEFLDLISKE